MTALDIEPIVEVVSAEVIPGGHRIACRFSEPYSEPIAPGGLYTQPNSGPESFAVHRTVSRQDDIVTFETFGVEEQPLPPVGVKFFFRGWWVPAAMDAALDTEAIWEHRTYPDTGDHDHCLFTWETLAAYSDYQKTGWWSAAHGWIAERAYDDFIANDIYHLRERSDA